MEPSGNPPVTPGTGIMPIQPPDNAPAAPIRTKLSRTSDFLMDSYRTGTVRYSYEKRRRYAQLQLGQIYTSLVTLYSSLFLSQWQHFKRYSDIHNVVAAGVTPHLHAARVYISCWIHDLYVSNREAVRQLSPLAFQQHYQHEEILYSNQYDYFLVQLSASIRPTNIKGAMEDTIFIPVFRSTTPEWTTNNPFNITDYDANSEFLQGMIYIMSHGGIWHIETLFTNTLGRPSWLFDWHDAESCLAWYPLEGNYSMDDVSIAYIVGVPCTPNLGPRDFDDWQQFPNNTVPAQFSTQTFDRVRNQSFFGAYPVRTHRRRSRLISLDPAATAPSTTAATTSTGTSTRPYLPATPATQRHKRPRTDDDQTESLEDSSGNEPEAEADPTPMAITVFSQTHSHEFRIIDWTYFARHILNQENHTRSGALRILALL